MENVLRLRLGKEVVELRQRNGDKIMIRRSKDDGDTFSRWKELKPTNLHKKKLLSFFHPKRMLHALNVK